MESKNKAGFVSPLAAGVVVGVAVGMMFAPKAGKETREIIWTRTSGPRHKTTDYVEALRRKLGRSRNSDVDDKALITE